MPDRPTYPDLPALISEACLRIAPLYPLKDFVAVNPFVGLAGMHFVDACALMRRVAHGGLAMPATYYRERADRGLIGDDDLEGALAHARRTLPPEHAAFLEGWSASTLKAALRDRRQPDEAPAPADSVNTVADLVDRTTTHERTESPGWRTFIVDEISKWCAAYYDQGQASWRMPWRGETLYDAWKQAAQRDANPEVMGLRGFRAFVAALPDSADDAISAAIAELEVAPEDATDFLHRALMSIAGWSGYVQYRVRTNALNGTSDDGLRQLLAIRLAYDVALFRQHPGQEFRRLWAQRAVPAPERSDLPDLLTDHLWLLADENAYQRRLLADLTRDRPESSSTPVRPAVQAVFCIDVRSEPLRRALEAESPEVETLGFAGFFGFALEYIPFGQDDGHAQCPVLLKPGIRIREALRDGSPERQRDALQAKSLSQRMGHAWNAFKTSAVSGFSFVETAGVLSGIKLVQESLGLHHGAPQADHLAPAVGRDATLNSGMNLGEQVAVAANALQKMGLTERFGRIVVLCGHGSDTNNNPYTAALDCGACGGHSGEVNARVAVAVLNDPAVRDGLRACGVSIPDDTVFLAGLHNTTTDVVRLFDLEAAPATHREDVMRLQGWLTGASRTARRRRAGSLGYGDLPAPQVDRQVFARSRNWAQTRPEWGLAGNAAFVAAPRERTRGLDGKGRVFLHSYDHRTDEDGSVLELILTAPMVVASWINLQYFASTVNNQRFGSGNKTLHNVVGTLGIWQGNSGDLQVGLPVQSVHDGHQWRHEPLRLSVVIEAPTSALNRVIAQNPGVRELLDNGWLHLFAFDGSNRQVSRYYGAYQWQEQEA